MWQEKENSSVQLSPLRPAAKDERKELLGLTSPKEPMCLADTCVCPFQLCHALWFQVFVVLYKDTQTIQSIFI